GRAAANGRDPRDILIFYDLIREQRRVISEVVRVPHGDRLYDGPGGIPPASIASDSRSPLWILRVLARIEVPIWPGMTTEHLMCGALICRSVISASGTWKGVPWKNVLALPGCSTGTKAIVGARSGSRSIP